MKPRVAIFVLCGPERTDWINPRLFFDLLRLKDERFEITVDIAHGFRPFAQASNWCVMQARNQGFDALLMCDNDMILPETFADILHEAITSGKAVVGLKAGIPSDANGRVWMTACHDNGKIDGNFRLTGAVGSGVLFISSEVWSMIPKGPWFRWLDSEDEQGTPRNGEDYYFADLVQSHGLEVWTHAQAAGHLKTMNVTRVAQALGRDKQ